MSRMLLIIVVVGICVVFDVAVYGVGVGVAVRGVVVVAVVWCIVVIGV